MSAFVHSKEFSEFRKARSNMLLSRKNQLLLEFSFWNEPIPRSGPNIYELRSYQLRVSPAVGGHHVPSFLCAAGAGHTPLMLRAVAGHVFCDVCLAHFLPCPVLLLISFFGLFGFFFFFFFLLCGMWDLSSLTRDRTHTPLHWKQSLNHWTTREVPFFFFVFNLLSHSFSSAKLIFYSLRHKRKYLKCRTRYII